MPIDRHRQFPRQQPRGFRHHDSNTTAHTPASTKAVRALAQPSICSAVCPFFRYPPSSSTRWGSMPRWPITGMPFRDRADLLRLAHAAFELHRLRPGGDERRAFATAISGVS
jgi:hypothetical protein